MSSDANEVGPRSLAPPLMRDGERSMSPESLCQSLPPSRKPDHPSSTKKRQNSIDPSTGQKITKRRAARACASCRTRKVRCDVVEGFPCGNCRWDDVPCVIQESRRRKKNIYSAPAAGAGTADAVRPMGIGSQTVTIVSATPLAGFETGGGLIDGFGVHPVYTQQPFPMRAAAPAFPFSLNLPPGLGGWPSGSPSNGDVSGLRYYPDVRPLPQLPAFIKPFTKSAPEDIAFLKCKDALTVPSGGLRNALLRAYIQYVHPFVPIIELHGFLHAIQGNQASISLLLYQAIMFSASAFVDIDVLRENGFTCRKEARRVLFFRARHLYDFDYEVNRLTCVQSLLLMSYWYETPADQKDTWHWMGIAISLARTIGLNHNPAKKEFLTEADRHLWKRIWWSCFMRDRLIALGMRRPVRIVEDDFDVPMLQESDFVISPLPDDGRMLGPDCVFARDTEMQRQLAVMCIQHAKLSLLISRLLKSQYLVLVRGAMRPEHATSGTTYMLLPNKALDNWPEVEAIDSELQLWHKNLPEPCQYRQIQAQDIAAGLGPLAVHRSLLHMLYCAAVSALHRPNFSNNDAKGLEGSQVTPGQIQEFARLRLRHTAQQTVHLASELLKFDLVRRLPTVSVTVVLPATLFHMLDMRSPDQEARKIAERNYLLCRTVLHQLREIYVVAKYALVLIEEALLKLPAPLPIRDEFLNRGMGPPPEKPATPPPESAPFLDQAEMDMFGSAMGFDVQATVDNQDSPPLSDHDSASTPKEPSFSSTIYFAQDDIDIDAIAGWPDGSADLRSMENDISQFINFSGDGRNEELNAGNWMSMEPTAM